jgi:hypothetical protein
MKMRAQELMEGEEEKVEVSKHEEGEGGANVRDVYLNIGLDRVIMRGRQSV